MLIDIYPLWDLAACIVWMLVLYSVYYVVGVVVNVINLYRLGDVSGSIVMEASLGDGLYLR